MCLSTFRVTTLLHYWLKIWKLRHWDDKWFSTRCANLHHKLTKFLSAHLSVNPPENFWEETYSEMKSPALSGGTVRTIQVYVNIPVKSVSLFFHNHI